MEQLATPESIRLTAATLRLVEGLVQVTALGPMPVKGLAEPDEVRRTRGLELRIRVGLHSGEDDHGRGPSGLCAAFWMVVNPGSSSTCRTSSLMRGRTK